MLQRLLTAILEVAIPAPGTDIVPCPASGDIICGPKAHMWGHGVPVLVRPALPICLHGVIWPCARLLILQAARQGC